MPTKPKPNAPKPRTSRGRLSDNEYDQLRDAAIFAALKSGDPGPLDWTFRVGHDWPNTKGGSENIPPEINALRLFRPETRELALEKWQWQADRSKVAFEGIEYGSRVYRSRTLRAHLLALRWCHQHALHQSKLAGFLFDWLRLYWILELLSTVYLKHGPQSMRIGARSAGHPLHPIQSDYALALATEHRFDWIKPWRFLGPQNRKAEGNLSRQIKMLEQEALASCPAEIEIDIGLGNIGNLISSIPKWGSLVATHYYATEKGIAVWIEKQSGGNTVGITAAGCNVNEEPWCIGPSPKVWAGKERAWRQKPYHLICEMKNGFLNAYGEVAGKPIPEESHSLPLGTLPYHVIHDSNGLRKVE